MGKRMWLIAATGLIMLAVQALGQQSKLSYSGVYTAWGQSQHDFTFGRAEYDDEYVVQMLRMKLNFAVSENVRAITRFDLAQGWWGVDNEDRTSDRSGFTGGSSLFDFKDTNFLFHVDQAYIEFDIPDTPLMFRVGRFWYGFGNRLVLDNNLDGVQLIVNDKLNFSWAKISEGIDGIADVETTDPQGQVLSDGDDANLFMGSFKNKVNKLDYEFMGMYYHDAGDDDGTTYMPNDINYFRSRFTPHLSQLICFGLAANYKNKGWNLSGEFDLLFGKDDVSNNSIDSRQLVDINDGDLSGFNLYLKGSKDLTPKFTLGGVVGVGSGDDDVTSGNGNVNKLRTSGFFYVTEIWEDSIMPDEEGITPQGLGAPNVRGYRELENTTLAQINGTIKFTPKVSLFGSYTLIRATQDIHPWSVNEFGTTAIDQNVSAKDLGQEIDWKFDWKIYPQLVFTFRGGVFLPGDAAGYLINGTGSFDDPAWETKTTITLNF